MSAKSGYFHLFYGIPIIREVSSSHPLIAALGCYRAFPEQEFIPTPQLQVSTSQQSIRGTIGGINERRRTEGTAKNQRHSSLGTLQEQLTMNGTAETRYKNTCYILKRETLLSLLGSTDQLTRFATEKAICRVNGDRVVSHGKRILEGNGFIELIQKG
jgi:hypothetical protein